jgi:hypothetical protein
MHQWGEENVDWKGLDDAAYYIGGQLARWGRIHVSQTKEKFGTVRVYCSFGWDSFYGLWRPRYCRVPTWWPWKLDLMTFSRIESLVNKVAIPYQKWIYKRTYRKTVQKWPHLYQEIVSCADWGELFDGALPGYKHSDYWQEVK